MSVATTNKETRQDDAIDLSKTINPYKMFNGAFIPLWLMERPEISPGAKIIYARIALHAGKTGVAWPRQELLAKETGISNRSVRTYITELVAHKLIRSVRKGLCISNRYFFLRHEWMGLDKKADPEGQEEESASGPERQTLPVQSGELYLSERQNLPVLKEKILGKDFKPIEPTQKPSVQVGVSGLIKFFFDHCKLIKGFEPQINGSVDGKLLKSLLKKYPEKVLEGLMIWFLKSPESDRLSPSLGVCCSSYIVNKWRLTTSGKTGIGKSIDAAGRELKPLL